MRGIHQSVWMATIPETHYAPLDKAVAVDVAIIGAGLTGITSALLLKEAGLTVAVLDAGPIAAGVSGQTTAKITSQHQLFYRYLIDHFGREDAQLYADANQDALNQMKSWIATKHIACDLKESSAYVFTESERDVDMLKQEVEAAQSLNLPASFTTETELPFPIKGAMRFADQAQFHPRKYLLALAQQIEGDGSYIFEQTRAIDITERNRCTVQTEMGAVVANDVIIATHFPI